MLIYKAHYVRRTRQMHCHESLTRVDIDLTQQQNFENVSKSVFYIYGLLLSK